jgi:hypothetical protein
MYRSPGQIPPDPLSCAFPVFPTHFTTDFTTGLIRRLGAGFFSVVREADVPGPLPKWK